MQNGLLRTPSRQTASQNPQKIPVWDWFSNATTGGTVKFKSQIPHLLFPTLSRQFAYYQLTSVP
jgi:hypothetical protein